MKKKLILIGLLCTMCAFGVYELFKVGGQNEGGAGQTTGWVAKKSNDSKAADTSAESSYNIEAYDILLPIRNNPNWANAAAARASELQVSHVLTNTVTTLETAYITQPADRSANTLWGVARITGKNAHKLRLNMLDSAQTSSDAANSLKSHYSLVGGSSVFSPQVIGVIWGANGPDDHTGEQVITSGEDRDVDEIDIIFIQSPYYPYTDQASYTSIDQYVTAQHFAIDQTFKVMSGDTTLATATKHLALAGGTTPITPSLTISYSPSDGMVVITPTVDTNSTSKLWYSTDLINWHLDTTVNAGDVFKRTPADAFRGLRISSE